MTSRPSSRASRRSGSGIPSAATSTRKSSPAWAMPTLTRSRRCCSTWEPRSTRCRPVTSWSRSSWIPKKIPLIVVSDIVVGETSMYRRLHLPGPDLPGALGIFRLPSLGHAEGGPLPPAGRGAADRHGDGLRREDAPVHGIAHPGPGGKAQAAGIREERLRSGPPLQARRGHVSPDGGQHRLRRQAGRFREGAGGKQGRDPDFRSIPPVPAPDRLST